MNRAGNRLNASTLGAGRGARLVFARAEAWCEAQVAAVLLAGRKLRKQCVAEVVPVFNIRLAGALRAASTATATSVGKLAGYTAVYLRSALSAAAEWGANVLRLRPGFLSGAQAATSDSRFVISKRQAVRLAASLEARAVTAGGLRKCQAVRMRSSVSAASQPVATLTLFSRKTLRASYQVAAQWAARLLARVALRAHVTASAQVTATIDNLDASPASSDRIAVVPAQVRAVVVPE